jgi:microcompartment protein CcmK/EutM
MTCDVTPSLGHTVSGSLVIATGANDANNGDAVYGTYTVSVYSDSNEATLVTEVTSTYDATGARPVNSFSIDGLTAGTYYAVITSQYSKARHVTIQVSDSDIDAGAIAIICCDYNGDGVISVPDAKFVYGAASTSEGAEYCDLNGDGVVSVPDAKITYSFALSSVYPQLVIS